MTKNVFQLCDAVRECMRLFGAGFRLKNGRWTLGQHGFSSRQAAVARLNDLVVKRAIERISLS